MDLFEKILTRECKISVVGLGYVGLPLAIAFGDKASVIGFDIDRSKIQLYGSGIDITNEVGNEGLANAQVEFTSDVGKLREACFHIIAVPTPVYDDNLPNLEPLMQASILVGRNLCRGSVVVYESTVYPGVTEELCIPVLENESGLKCPEDFKVGYSPERINPGDKEHTLKNTVKVVAAVDAEALDTISAVYGLVVEAGLFRAESIKIAEAAKIIENSQRYINIAFMNEVSVILSKFGIDTKAVLETASTKWNFLNFTPGLPGGPCIGVDPYYLLYKCGLMGYMPRILSSSRKINNTMGKYTGEHAIRCLKASGKEPSKVRAAVLGIAYKEDCTDTRNSKVPDIISILEENGAEVFVCDPSVSSDRVYSEHGIRLCCFDELKEIDIVIAAVAHRQFRELTLEKMKGIYRDQKPILLDVKGIYDKELAEKLGYMYWRL